MEQYQAGQEVAYNTSPNYFSGCFLRFGKVAKVTASGQVILENGTKFSNRGRELKTKKTSYPTAYLVDLDQAKNVIAMERDSSKRKIKVRKLEEAIKARRTGNGSYPRITEHALELMDQLIVELGKKQGE